MGSKYAILLCLVFCAGWARAAEPPLRPVVEGPEGARAFADLGRYYQDSDSPPEVEGAIRDLESADAAKRARAGQYVYALLAQSLADEDNGRGNWRQLPAWGGGAESDAREFRNSLAARVAEKAQAAEALDAALWLIDEDKIAANEEKGVELLCRIKAPQSVHVFDRLLADPHPNEAVVVAVLGQVADRKLQTLAPAVRRLATHYRATVREAARGAAKALGIRDLVPYKPEEAFTPRLDAQLKTIAGMVEANVPGDARWYRLTVTHPPRSKGEESAVEDHQGWLLSATEDEVDFLDLYGRRLRFAKKNTKLEVGSLEQQAKELLKIRAGPTDRPLEGPTARLSRGGVLTGQFEPGFVSLPEVLAGVWLYQRGDKCAAAELLFPRIEAAADDRWLVWAARDYLGHEYHQRMLEAFSYERDYGTALDLARHLSQPAFDGYQYQPRAKRLAEQLARRTDDFKDFRLPTPAEWARQKKELTRVQQIEYLAPRLRLLNGLPNGGHVSYSDRQSARPGFAAVWDEKQRVINPYVELREMNITVKELPALVPFLADDNYMPTFSYWREFHPARMLHQVNWLVARIVNEVARRDLAPWREVADLDEDGRRRLVEAVLAWCRQHQDMTAKELVLEVLGDTHDWGEFETAAREAVRGGYGEALPVLVRRFDDFPDHREDLAQCCYRLDSGDAAPAARKWLGAKDAGVRFWAALILLQHGDKTNQEGLAELEKSLAKDDGEHWYPYAIDALLALKTEKTNALACGILNKKRFGPACLSFNIILQRLFLAGRQECLDYLLAKLHCDSVTEMSDEIDEGDRVADRLTGWRTGRSGEGEVKYEEVPPAAERFAKRTQFQAWLKRQFALIQKGQKTEIKVIEGPIDPGGPAAVIRTINQVPRSIAQTSERKLA